MPEVELLLAGTVGGAEAGVPLTDLLRLLDSVAESRSLRGAAEALGMSYRGTWGRALAYERQLGTALIVKTKGHGTGLSPAGLHLRDALRAAVAELEAPIAAAQARLRAELAAIPSASPKPLRMAASHDLLLIEAAQALAGMIELSVVGSADAIARLRAGTADAAGFHGGDDAGDRTAAALAALGYETVPLFRREQGLIVARGNPLGIASVSDLAGREARFVNRQVGSGTRTWFDRLVREAKLRPADIEGYSVEEFTHQAVAALVASGGADAGMGLRAAAERFGLGFVPLGRETYFIAAAAGDERIRELRGAVEARVTGMPGYSPAE